MNFRILTTAVLLMTVGLAVPAMAANFKPEHVKRLLETKQCPGCDLRSADLRSTNLSYADLRGADLSYANLSYADLRGANLTGADLRGANLEGAKMP